MASAIEKLISIGNKTSFAKSTDTEEPEASESEDESEKPEEEQSQKSEASEGNTNTEEDTESEEREVKKSESKPDADEEEDEAEKEIKERVDHVADVGRQKVLNNIAVAFKYIPYDSNIKAIILKQLVPIQKEVKVLDKFIASIVKSHDRQTIMALIIVRAMIMYTVAGINGGIQAKSGKAIKIAADEEKQEYSKEPKVIIGKIYKYLNTAIMTASKEIAAEMKLFKTGEGETGETVVEQRKLLIFKKRKAVEPVLAALSTLCKKAGDATVKMSNGLKNEIMKSAYNMLGQVLLGLYVAMTRKAVYKIHTDEG